MSSARARLGLLVAMLAALFVPLTDQTPAKAAGAVPGDWMITRIQAGSDGAMIDVGWSALGTRTANDPIVLGAVWQQSNTFTDADVYEPDLFLVPTNGFRLRTSEGAGGMDIAAYPNEGGTWTYQQGKRVVLDANESAVLVSFVAGSNNTTEFLNWTLYLGHASVTTQVGTGSQILRQVDRFHQGIGAEAGYVSAGSTQQARTLPTGIVGGFLRICEYCTMEWTAPGGRAGATTVRGGSFSGYGYRERSGSRFFSGPAGSWTWKWEGLQVDPRASSQVLGAYAPIGNAWTELEDIGDFGGTATDWVLATVKAGPAGASTPIVKSIGTIKRPAGSDVALGVGRAGSADSYIDVAALGDQGFTTQTSDGLGSVRVEVRASPASDDAFTISWYPAPMAPNEERNLLIFAAGGVIAQGSVTATADNGGALSVTSLRQGKGSGLITAAGPGRGGAAIDADRVLVGSGNQTTSVAAGIAGGLSFRCDKCTETWQAPDGRSGTYTHEDQVVTSTGTGKFTFAGPSGSWTWTWSGVNVETGGAAGIVGAYAPIGTGWNLFG